MNQNIKHLTRLALALLLLPPLAACGATAVTPTAVPVANYPLTVQSCGESTTYI